MTNVKWKMENGFQSYLHPTPNTLHPQYKLALPSQRLLSFLTTQSARMSAREARPGFGKAMPETNRFTIICPGCEATLIVDAQTGTLLSHEEKQKPLSSFEEMAKDLDKQKQTREQIFAQELSSMKDRERLLEEKFREAMKRAEKDTKVYRSPLDMD